MDRLQKDLDHMVAEGLDSGALYKRVCKYLRELVAYRTFELTPERVAELAQAEAEANEPLTQEQISGMHFDKIWLDYGEDNGGEWAVVLFGKIYSIDTLEGAGFEEMLFDLADGETLDHPSGQYTVRRHKPKELEGGAEK